MRILKCPYCGKTGDRRIVRKCISKHVRANNVKRAWENVRCVYDSEKGDKK